VDLATARDTHQQSPLALAPRGGEHGWAPRDGESREEREVTRTDWERLGASSRGTGFLTSSASFCW
jgi:hypothetical protein